MPPRATVPIGVACAITLGCAAAPNAYRRSIELNTAGSHPMIGTSDGRVWDVLGARGYDVRATRWYGQGRLPLGTRPRADGWDLITASAKINERITWVDPSLTYHWTLYARTFGADGSERPASLEARADLDSVITALGTAAALRDTAGAQPERSTEPEGAALRLDRCARGDLVGESTGLPPWGGTLATGTAAGRLVAAMEGEGWTVVRPMVGIRRQPGGVDVVTVFGGRWLEPRARYVVRVAFCDSTGKRSPPRSEARADAARLVSLLRSATAPPR